MMWQESLQNRKSDRFTPYKSMCLVGILMLVMRFLSSVFSDLLYTFRTESVPHISKNLAAFLAQIFGVPEFKLYTAFKYIFSSEGFDTFLSMLVSLVVMLVPAIVYSKICGQQKSERFVVKGPLVRNFFGVFCFSYLLSSGFAWFSTNMFEFFFGPKSEYVSSSLPTSTDAYSMIMSFLQICVFVPFVEEYVFRGIIFNTLKKHGTVFAIVASAVTFGVMHTDPVQINYAFCFGVIVASVTAFTGNIKTAVLIHALNNSISVLFGYITDLYGENVSGIIMSMFSILVSFVGIYGVYLAVRKDGICQFLSKIAKEENEGHINSGRVKDIFCVPVLLVIVLYAVRIFLLEVFA